MGYHSCKDANYNLIGHTDCYDCMINDICTNYSQLSCLICHIKCTRKVWKPTLICLFCFGVHLLDSIYKLQLLNLDYI